ncbi:hypothetical protein [Prevotella aurantiaca]|uniref:hypothetical protein n=1 Tax=Prevotella aurantiaca TaxID=596085 RepID=UPI001CAD54AE|nr:hypothetical protein [Prevotella aurantiaca]MBF1386448.1 hypothetical protein [Prevotella aurantiaca]
MKKIFFLSAICLATSMLTTSCSSELTDLPEQESAPAVETIPITVIAGTGEDTTTTRALLSEEAGKTSPWKWEANDKIQVITTNPSGSKVVTELKLKPSSAGKARGEFTGNIPKDNVTSGNTYRFYYVGKGTITATEAQTGKIEIDLSSQSGKLADLKKHCVLSGMGKIVVENSKADIEGAITLKNSFAIAHFAMSTADGTAITKIGLRGAGVYDAASVDLNTGEAVGTSEAGLEVDPDANIFFPNGATDFYIVFVPGAVAPAFDAYYAGSYSSVITTVPQARNYAEENSFVYYKGSKAVFSVSDHQRVAITNGNMQYVMPVSTYTSKMKSNTLEPNAFIRKTFLEPIKLKGKLTTHAGYYRLAPEQWKLAMPKNVSGGGNYTYATVTVGGKKYISPETYRYFDTPSWGTIDNPTLLPYTSKLSGSGVDTQYDFGNKLLVGNKKTRVLTSDEWDYLIPKSTSNSNNRIWINGTTKVLKWARCFIDEDGNGSRGTNPAELRGYLIFPDNMTLEDAKKAFTNPNPTFGSGNAASNPTTYEKIKNSGAVFIPLTAYRSPGNATLVQWGNHGNYFTSSYGTGGIIHVLLKESSHNTHDASAAGQGCMSRLVQNL